MTIHEIEIQDSAGLREQLNAAAIISIERKGRIGEAPLIMYWDDAVAPVPTEQEIQDAQTQAAEKREREKQNERKREKLKAILSREDSTINSVLALRERVEMLEEYLGLRDPRDVDL